MCTHIHLTNKAVRVSQLASWHHVHWVGEKCRRIGHKEAESCFSWRADVLRVFVSVQERRKAEFIRRKYAARELYCIVLMFLGQAGRKKRGETWSKEARVWCARKKMFTSCL